MAKEKIGDVDELQIGKVSKNMKELNKALEKANISQKQFNTLTKELQKAHKDLNLVKKTEDYTKAQQKLNREYKDWYRSLEMIKNIGTAVFAVDSIRDIEGMAIKMIKLNSEMHRNLVLAGKNGEAMRGYQKTLNNLSIQLGATHEDANKIVQVLATKQYAGTAKDIDTAAMATYKLAEATKLSKEEIAQVTVELQKWGQISAATTEAMYADIMKVAKANGLTKEGISAILKQTQNWSGIMKAFGKSPAEVQKYNMSLSKTVSALEKVGISAQTTTALLDKLTDPERIEENIAAYAALGISIEDALSGNIDSMDMASGLKDFGEKLKTMGPIAGAQYAKAFGVSYKDAIKATTADFDELNKLDMTPEEKASKELSAAMESTRDSVEKINSTFERIGGYLRKFGPWILIIGGMLFELFGIKLTRVITGAGEKLTSVFSKSGKDAANDLASSMEDAADKSGKALQAGMYGGAAAALAEIENAKKESDAAERKRRTAMAKQEADEYKDFLKQAVDAVSANKVTIDKSADLVFLDKQISAQEKLGEIEQAQYEKAKEHQDNLVELEKIKKDISKTKDTESKEILRLRKEQLKEMIENDKTAIDDLKKAAEQQKETIKGLEKAKDDLKTKLESGVAEVVNSGAYKFGEKLGNGINAIETKAKDIGEAIKSKIEKVKLGKLEVGDGKEAKKNIENAIKDASKAGSKSFKVGAFGGLSKLGSKIGAAFKKEAKKTKIKPPKAKADKKSFISAMKGAATSFKNALKNFKIGVKAAAGNSKVLGAMGKLGGALGGVAKVAGKLGGAMGIVAIVMRIIGKALEKMEGPMDMINTIMDNLVGILTPILEAILKPLLPLVQVLIKALLPPLLKILSLLIKVIHVLIQPILALIKALSHLPGLGFLKDVAEGIDAATGPEVTKALDEAANKISDSNTDLAQKTEENTDAVEGKTKGESLSFNGGKVMVKSSTSASGSNSTTGGNSNTSSAANSATAEGSSTKNSESQMLTIAALSKVKESIDGLSNKFVVFMNKMNDTFDKMASSDSTKMYQERAAIEQAFGLDERKVVNVNIADAAGIIGGGKNIIKSIFGGGNDEGRENHTAAATGSG